jgi:hypothetical protein
VLQGLDGLIEYREHAVVLRLALIPQIVGLDTFQVALSFLLLLLLAIQVSFDLLLLDADQRVLNILS